MSLRLLSPMMSEWRWIVEWADLPGDARVDSRAPGVN
jgi:hypothetical protein